MVGGQGDPNRQRDIHRDRQRQIIRFINLVVAVEEPFVIRVEDSERGLRRN